MLKERLVERKLKSGTTDEEARRFVEFSDMANVRECLEHTKEADLCFILGQDGTYQVAGR